jgi:hypothetical protein
MSALSLKRHLFLSIISGLAATTLFAMNPSARYETRMVYNVQSSELILFGGVTAVDSGTKKAYRLDDTWQWTGARWIQRFPGHTPAARSAHVMVYDSNRAQIVMFSGRGETADLGDTWVYRNSDWSQLSPPNSATARFLAGAAFDPVRDRIVLFGGTQTSADGKTLTPIHDTWEFDGTTWKQIGGDGPTVSKPLLAYDAPRNQVIMLALDSTAKSKMFAYDGAAGKWNEVTPATLPPCVNEGALAYQDSNQTLVYTGGVCTNATGADETYEWDGTTWNKVTLITPASRLFGAAIAFDPQAQLMTMFGGSPVVGLPVADTWIYGSGAWLTLSDSTRPGPRSLFAFTTDPVNNTIWMFGGVDEVNTFSDFWQYQNGEWQLLSPANTPVGCQTPTAAFDTDRSKLVLICADASSGTFEWDGTAWKNFTGLKTLPPFHHFASMAYDPTLKKSVLLGGFDGTNYLDQTWMWDGATWSQQKKNPAPARALASMWYDPTLKKTVIYGGVGRLTSTDRVTRYSDMWTFDGNNGWTQLTPTGGTPGMRYGAQTTIDPRSNHVLLFGGLRVDAIVPVPPSTTTEVQVYANDMWEWDGSAWKQVHPDGLPPARENGRMAFDPTRNEMVMFGGYGGHFLSDVWTYNPTTWQIRIFDPTGKRRRVAH